MIDFLAGEQTVGRPERELDPEAGTVQRFAVELRTLRKKVGDPSYRAMAKIAHYSPATLAAAAGGRRLPSLDVTLAYVRACSASEDEWRARWTAAATAESVPGLVDGSTVAPYLGLTPFGTADSALFFGRERFLGELRAKLDAERLVAVVGPSGSGKSSLLRAGLLAEVERHVVCTPGQDPFQECAVELASGLNLPAGELAANFRIAPENLGLALRQARMTVLLIDQFEEVFTLCEDMATRAAFIAALLAVDHDDVRVILGLRADFFGHCAQHAELIPVFRDSQVLVGPMTTAELREVIIKPAASVGCVVEGALVSRLIGEAAGQPGVLPLISHVLLETWHRRRGKALTLAGYEATGGLERAVANTAEEVYVALEPEQLRAKDLLLRMVALGDETADTKRRVARAELGDDRDVDTVLDAFARARLLVLAHDSVEISHETLIRSWPRLRGWLDEDRERLAVHRQLTEAAGLWEGLQRDSSALYRGTRLAAVREREIALLTASEQAFLDASLAAERREQTRGRWFVTILAILLVLATAAGTIVFVQRQAAAEAAAIARSRQLAADATATAPLHVPEAIKLSLEAYAAHPTAEARSAVLSLAARRSYQVQLPLPRGMVTDVPVSPDSRLLASASEPGTVVLWDVRARARVAELRGEFGFVTAAAFDATGARLVAGTAQGELVLWDVPRRVLLGKAVTTDLFFNDVAFSPDGRLLASSATARAGTSEMRLWEVAGLRPSVLGSSAGNRVTLAFAPDGRTLAHTTADGSVTLWDTGSRSISGRLPGSGGPVSAVAYSLDGRLIATGEREGVVRLWSAETRTTLALLRGHSMEIGNVAFGQDGERLYSTDVNGGIVVWDVTRRARVGQLYGGKPEWLTPVSASADGKFVVAGDSGVGVLLWERDRQPYLGHTGTVAGLAFSPNGRTLFSTGYDRTLVAWDPVNRAARQVATEAQSDDPWAMGPQVSPDGSLLATVSGQTEVTLWHAETLTAKVKITGLRSSVSKVVFAPGGTTLAIMDNGPSVVLWDNGTRRDIPLADVPVDLAYSPDGTMLAVAFPSGRIQLLDARTHAPLTIVDFGSNHVSAVAFSPDSGMLVSSAHDGTVVIWDTKAWRRKRDLVGHRGRVRAVAVSPDQRFVATTDDETVSLWDIATGQRWATLRGHTELITAVAWSPDGASLVSASRDQSITPWSVDVDRAIAVLCGTLAQDFSETPPEVVCR